MALPADVTYGTVRGCLTTNGLSDTPGLGAPLGGYVSFDPTPSYLLHDDGETVIRMRTRIVPLDPADGTFVVDDLIATDCPALTPTDWTYRVSFAGADRSLSPFFINLAGGSDVGIASVTPVASSSGDVTPNAIQEAIAAAATDATTKANAAQAAAETYADTVAGTAQAAAEAYADAAVAGFVTDNGDGTLTIGVAGLVTDNGDGTLTIG